MIDRPMVSLAVAALTMLACSPGEPGSAFAKSASAKVEALPPGTVSPPGVMLRFVLAPSEQAARYRVRERLVGHDLPNDAVGETKSVTGAIAFDSTGSIVRQESKFVVDAATFVSDQNRRDGFVRGRLLDARQYPSVVLVPSSVRGVALPLPTSGSRAIEMTGDLTVRGVTRPTTWKGTVNFKDGRVVGSAATEFTFDDFQIEQPRVPVLLSVADTIRLEIDFNLIPQR
ncbi:MAG TPA: YceI family protein [Gemmatimonadaceae bacterium]|nr:YceI family protein [Gemmatimonadaceae bacterium]